MPVISSVNNIQKTSENRTQKINILSLVFYLLADTSRVHSETARATADQVQESIKAIRELVTRLESLPGMSIPPEMRETLAKKEIDDRDLLKLGKELNLLQLDWAMRESIANHIQTTITSERQSGDISSTALNTTTQQLMQVLAVAGSTSKANLEFTRALMR